MTRHNLITDGYLNAGQRPSRYEPMPEHWLEMQRRLGSWGNSSQFYESSSAALQRASAPGISVQLVSVAQSPQMAMALR